jgi:virulence factor Mce-like protein
MSRAPTGPMSRAPRIALRRLLAPLAILVAAAGAGLAISACGITGGGGYEVRALFDNAGYAVSGEQVRIAGAPVGSIAGLSVTRSKLAAVTLRITDKQFTPWYANATCTIRPQSLIAERYVDCEPGSSSHRPLRRISRGAGAGSHLLPVARTSSPIDPDIVQDIAQEPVTESLSVILNELGTGLAGRGADLNAVILRSDPALAQTERVLKLLDGQNRTLAKLATDADTVLAPLAKARGALADFVVKANHTATATAQRSADISHAIELLPPFLRELRPLMDDLGQLSSQGTPLMTSLGQNAGSITAALKSLTPFASKAKTALLDLGNTAQQSQAKLIASEPLARQLLALGKASKPSAAALDKLTASLQSSGGIQQLMSLLYYGTGAANGFDADGHYVRIAPITGSCNAYARASVPGCSANFTDATAAVAKQAAKRVKTGSPAEFGGLLKYLIGGGA